MTNNKLDEWSLGLTSLAKQEVQDLWRDRCSFTMAADSSMGPPLLHGPGRDEEDA